MTAWKTRSLAEFGLTRISTVDPRKSPDEEFELYSIPGHDAGAPEKLRGSEIGSAKKEVTPGRVLLSKINPRINRVRVVGNKGTSRQIASTEWIQFEASPEVLPEFLAYQLRQVAWRRHFANNVSGVGGSLMRLRRKALADVEVVIPPLAEQHHILTVIENHFTRIDSAVASLTRAKVNVERARASVLKAAVEGRLVPTEAEIARKEGRDYEPASVLLERILTERKARHEAAQKGAKRKKKYKEPVKPETKDLPELPEGWVCSTVEQVGEIASGQTPRGLLDELAADGDFPWFRVGDMNSPQNQLWMKSSRTWVTSDVASRYGLHIRPAGTIIFPKRGGAIATNKKRRLHVPSSYDLNTMGVIFPDTLSAFGWVFFLHLDLNSLADGSNVPQINHKDVLPLLYPLPPLAEQHRIVEEVDRQLSILDAVADYIDASLARCERLRQAILKRAFEGRLVIPDEAAAEAPEHAPPTSVAD